MTRRLVCSSGVLVLVLFISHGVWAQTAPKKGEGEMTSIREGNGHPVIFQGVLSTGDDQQALLGTTTFGKALRTLFRVPEGPSPTDVRGKEILTATEYAERAKASQGKAGIKPVERTISGFWTVSVSVDGVDIAIVPKNFAELESVTDEKSWLWRKSPPGKTHLRGRLIFFHGGGTVFDMGTKTFAVSKETSEFKAVCFEAIIDKPAELEEWLKSSIPSDPNEAIGSNIPVVFMARGDSFVLTPKAATEPTPEERAAQIEWVKRLAQPIAEEFLRRQDK